MTRKFGTRAEVWDGLCTMTRGGLTKDDLQLNAKTGKLVSKKKSEIAKSNYAQFGFNKRKQPEPEPEKQPKRKRRRKKKIDKTKDE